MNRNWIALLQSNCWHNYKQEVDTKRLAVPKMPLLVTDYSWTQTDSTVYISVPLKGAKVGKVDILSTDEYLKVMLVNNNKRCVPFLLYVGVTHSILCGFVNN